MRAKDFVPTSKPRNFVAKNQKTAGAGAHKDKKRAEKQGDVKHKAKQYEEGVAEGSSESVSLRDMVDVVDRHYPKYYAELSGSDISDKQFERAIVNAYKKIMQKQSVAEGSDAEAYKQKLLSSLPQMMRFYKKNVQGWKPSKEQMLAAVETGYTVMKHTGDVKQAGKAVMDELNTLHRMSQGQQGVAEGSKMARVDKSAKAPKPKNQQEYDAVEKYRKDLAQSYNKEPNFGIKDDEEENQWWIDYDMKEGVAEGAVITKDQLVDIYIKGKGKNNMPIQKKVGAQIPNGKVNSFIAKVAEKYGLNPNAFVYGPSQTTEGWKSKVAGAALAGDKKWSK